MLRNLLLGTSLLALSACGGGGKSALIEACIEQGDSKDHCACMADKLEEGLSPEAFDAMVLGAQGKDEESEAAMNELGLGEAMATGGVMIGAIAACGIKNFTD